MRVRWWPGIGKRAGRALVAIALLASLAPPLEGRAAAALAVPVGIKVSAELKDAITSLTAHVGDTFVFITTKDEKLGDLHVPAGTLGHGRLAVVTQANGNVRGTLGLQADSLDLADGRTISVNVDNTHPMRGHLSERHTRLRIVPIPIGIVPISSTTTSGNMVLDAGTPFFVVTTVPRSAPAPLLTAAPAPTASPAPVVSSPATP